VVASPLDRDEFERWRTQSRSAAETAALAADGGRHDWSCFLWEQAAQLAVKGLLHGLGLDAWGHDLTVLSARAAEALGKGWAAAASQAAARLSRHYIPTRYPDAHASGAPSSHYTEADTTQAESDARRILETVDRSWATLGRAR
jgi:HEPN domain-containing protein